MLMIFGKFKSALLLMILILPVASFLLGLASVRLVRATDFTVAPTFDLTTSSNIAGANNTVYEFHGEDPDPSVALSNFSVVIPAGYVVNPAYLTTTPGLFVMNGSGSTIGVPPSGTGGNATTTTTSGIFAVYVKGKLVGTSTLVAPTPINDGLLTFVFPQAAFIPNSYIDLTTVQGVLFNPTTPGVYTWSGNATPEGPPPNDPVIMNARSGYSQLIDIAASTLFPVQVGTNTYNVSIVSDSVISNFSFDQSAKSISFDATGTGSTCNVTIQKVLLGEPYTILVDGVSVTATMNSNSTDVSMYLNYTPGMHEIEVVGTTAVPEFSGAATVSVVVAMVAVTMSLVALKLKKPKHRALAF